MIENIPVKPDSVPVCYHLPKQFPPPLQLMSLPPLEGSDLYQGIMCSAAVHQTPCKQSHPHICNVSASRFLDTTLCLKSGSKDLPELSGTRSLALHLDSLCMHVLTRRQCSRDVCKAQTCGRLQSAKSLALHPLNAGLLCHAGACPCSPVYTQCCQSLQMPKPQMPAWCTAQCVGRLFSRICASDRPWRNDHHVCCMSAGHAI